MLYAVLSDIHGNLPALEKTLKSINNVDGYIILGDVVNYGPWSNECVELVESLNNCHKILGNHEEFFLKGCCSSDNLIVKKFFKTCYPNFKHFEAIKKYEKKIEFKNFFLQHTILDKKIFEDSNIYLNKNYFIGHSHTQYLIKKKNFFLFNPGSVGQNRKKISKSSFMTYDFKKKKYNFYNQSYNFKYLITEMKKKNYPKECIDYYIKKNEN
jgi:putative phosphoesterase